MRNLRFRATGVGESLETLVARAWPTAKRRCWQSSLDACRILVDGAVVHDLHGIVPPGALVEAALDPRDSPGAPRALPLLAERDAIAVLDKPAGWPSRMLRSGGERGRRLFAAALGRELDTFWPAHELDAEVGGPWAVARTQAAAARLAEAFANRGALAEHRAITATPPWFEGSLRADVPGRPGEIDFEVVASRAGVSELVVRPRDGASRSIRIQLARAGFPIVGDVFFGGILAVGGLRLRCARLALPADGLVLEVPEPADFWPAEPLFPPDHPRPTLLVSHASAAALARGHPWILKDADTSDAGRYRPGTLVEVRSVRGERAGLARIEGEGRISARIWTPASRRGDIASVEERVVRALAKRRGILDAGATDALRLVHAEADDLPGLAIDRLGPLLRVLVVGRACERTIERALDATIRQLQEHLGPEPPVVRVSHLLEQPQGRLRGVDLIRGELEAEVLEGGRFPVRERGLRFWVETGLAEPYRPHPGTGLFLDQRVNRERIAARAAGGRWLNLFCHTGAFSVAILAAGAREVVSVDLSAPYLRWLEANLLLNGLERAPHRSVRGDARRYLERLDPVERFDGVILDPPTAAHAGRRFWSLRRDGGTLLGACLRRLRPGGTLLVCRNERGARGSLAKLVRSVAQAAGIELSSVEAAPPGPDFPRLHAFPEGDAFEGVIATKGA